ncbi:MAG: hypothetical protein RL514_1421 [Verrucomicrobiota bacterium]|jgi:hypothetical protein
MRPNQLRLLFALLSVVLWVGCASSEVRQGGSRAPLGGVGRVFLAPIHNATPDETAGRAVTELAATTLLAHGVPLAQTEDGLNRSRALLEEGKAAQIPELARSLECTHVLFGTVTEYRYKSDLDGSPIVSVTMRLVDVADGSTVWQGTSTKMTQYFGSLSRTAQVAVENLAQQMSGKARTNPRSRLLPQSANATEIEAAARNAPPGSSHIPASALRRGKYEPDPEQIRRRGDQ